MNFFPRLIGLGLLSVLVFLVMSCDTAKRTTNEFGSPNPIEGEVIAKPESRQIVRFTTAPRSTPPRAANWPRLSSGSLATAR
jgi:hypothetical protein